MDTTDEKESENDQVTVFKTDTDEKEGKWVVIEYLSYLGAANYSSMVGISSCSGT